MREIADLVAIVLSHMQAPCDLVAQSMGGLVALKAALTAPRFVRRLVLAATSGGLPMNALGADEWRLDYRRDFPNAAPWILEAGEDLSALLPGLDAPTLLLWGDSDPISPIAAGERLLDLLPNAALHIISGGQHNLARTHADRITPLIAAHLA